MRHSSWYLVPLVASIACNEHKLTATDTTADVRAMAAAASPPPTVAATEVAQPRMSVWTGQKLIRTAELHIQVDDVSTALDKLDRFITLRDAMLANSSAVRSDKEIHDAQIQLRVPASNFSLILGDLRALGTVSNENMRGQDVTREYADLETRINVKQETVDRLRLLLANRTGNLPQVLEVERELARAVTELEQLKGERQYVDQQVGDATVTIQLFDGRQPEVPGFRDAVTESLRKSLKTLQFLAAQLIYLGVFLAPWVVLALLGWRATKRWRRPPALARSAGATQ